MDTMERMTISKDLNVGVEFWSHDLMMNPLFWSYPFPDVMTHRKPYRKSTKKTVGVYKKMDRERVSYVLK